MQIALNSTTYPYARSGLVQSVTWKAASLENDRGWATGGAYNSYVAERSNTKSQAYGYKLTWTGVVAPTYISDFFFATNGGGDSTTRSECITTVNLNSTSGTYWNATTVEENKRVCNKNSWLIEETLTDITTPYATLTSYAERAMCYWIISTMYSPETSIITYIGEKNNFNVLPTVYIRPSAVCTNCLDEMAGTATNPYILKDIGTDQ